MTIDPSEFEKLGAFYLGREYDIATKKVSEKLVMYDSKDLVTHGVVLGMTGSGKTGLCLTLLEEAAIDRIPAIVIDPKGDIANFMLTFPQLTAENFRPWINEEDAAKNNQSPDEFAAAQAALWKNGLAEWGQTEERIRGLRDSVDVTVFTPGSSSGIPVSIMASMAAPGPELIEDSELFAERIESTVASILGLLGVTGDSISSREHILLSRICDHAWRKGENLTLEKIIGYVQAPPFSKIGVIGVEEFFPEKKRSEFALLINNLLAAPGFAAWLTGAPLDIKPMLHTAEGKPRVSIFSIAHLNDQERMFFVSLLLNQMVGWMRAQSGTTSLRALLYMDEIYGYLPPTQNPPSKRPMMILLKQARAFGLGILLATQNPVDLDYKALSNIGTWWLGRLQTERDKNRVLEGLEGAAGSQGGKFDRSSMDKMLAALGNRIFLMNNVHEDVPCVLHVRWCLTYLRGPLTRNQIKRLMDPRRKEFVVDQPAAQAMATPAEKQAPAASEPGPVGAAAKTGPKEPEPAIAAAPGRPDLPAALTQYYVPANSRPGGPQPLVYQPALLMAAEVSYIDARKKISARQSLAWLTKLKAESVSLPPVPGEKAKLDPAVLSHDPAAESASWGALPLFARRSATITTVRKQTIEYIYQHEALPLLYSPTMEACSQPGESEGDFRARLQHAAHEERDRQVDETRAKYGAKFQELAADRDRAEAALEREQSQARAAKAGTGVSLVKGVLGVLLGRKSVSGIINSGTSTVRAAGRARAQAGDIGRAEDRIAAIDEEVLAYKAELDERIKVIRDAFDMSRETLTTVEVRPMKKNIVITAAGIAWLPHYHTGGTLEPAWNE